MGDETGDKLFKVSTRSRPYNAGKMVGQGLVETAHVLYLIDNKAEFLKGIFDTVYAEYVKALDELSQKRNTKAKPK